MPKFEDFESMMRWLLRGHSKSELIGLIIALLEDERALSWMNPAEHPETEGREKR